ncbi:MAG: ferritin family protein [Acidobacteria bacterium]|nr:ferritin family protein [Acidobacteriota bacterium]
MKRDFVSLTPQEALHVAVFIEERNAQIYENFAALFSEFDDPESRELEAAFLDMAQEERRHGSLLQSRYLERYGTQRCALTDHDVRDSIEVPQIEEAEMSAAHRPSRLRTLEAALAAERNARRFYAQLVEVTQQAELRALYEEFAELERDHEFFLEEKIAAELRRQHGT